VLSLRVTMFAPSAGFEFREIILPSGFEDNADDL
jgi:hypothetical protein